MVESAGLRQIIAPAAVARGAEEFRETHKLHVDGRIQSVLGTRLTGSVFDVSAEPGSVRVRGRYTLHVWYLCDENETRVHTERVKYTVCIPVKEYGGVRSLDQDLHAQVQFARGPVIRKVVAADHSVTLAVEFAIEAEVFGKCQLWVRIYEPGAGEDEKLEGEDVWFDDEGPAGDLGDEDWQEDDAELAEDAPGGGSGPRR